MADWYIAKSGMRFGPLSMNALRELADAGTLLPDNWIWREGLPRWYKASNIASLHLVNPESSNTGAEVDVRPMLNENACSSLEETRSNRSVKWITTKQTVMEKTDSAASLVTSFLSIFVPALVLAVLFTFISMLIGLFLSQYYPVFGGVLERGLAEPWSPARKSLIAIHIFVFGLTAFILGAVLGTVLGIMFFLLRKENESSRSRLGL